MKLFRCLLLLIAIAGITGCASSSNQLEPATGPDRRLVFNGFSASAPEGEGWSISRTVKPPVTIGLYKKGRSVTNVLGATIAVGNIRKLPPAELFKLFEALRKAETESGRFHSLEFKVSRQKHRGAACQRYDNLVEDRSVPGQAGRMFILEMHGLTCIHPDRPTAYIDIQYSQRRLMTEEPSDIAARGEAFIQSVEFRPMTRPFVKDALEVTGSPQFVAPGHGSFWITRMKENAVSRIQPDMSGLAATVKVGAEPVGLVVTDAAVWVVNSGSATVSRINPASNRVVATIGVGSKPLLAASGFGSIWVTNNGSGTVSRINPDTNTVVATVTVGNHPSGVAAAGNAIWVTNFGDDTIQRIDPATNRAEDRPIAVGRKPNFLAGDGDSVWVNNQSDGTVYRVDTTTHEIVARVPVGSTLGGVSAGNGSVWVADFVRGKIVRIDPRQSAVAGPPIPAGRNPLGVTATPDGVFAVDVTNETVFRIEP